VNEAACSTLGYTREELIGKTLGDIDPGIDMSTWPEVWERMKGKLPPRETTHRTKDGRLIPVELMSNYIEFEGKEYNCTFGRNITERKQAQEALRLNSFAAERSSDAVYWLNPDSRIIDVNEAACRMLGYTREEMIGMPLGNINPGIDPSKSSEIWKLLKEGLPPIETEHRAKDGRLVPVEVIANYIEFEGKEYSCSFARDITERKQAEKALRLNNFALERTSDAVYWVSVAEIVDVNESACRMLGYSREEFQGMPLTNIDPLLPESEIVKLWERIKKEGTLTFETQHKARDGRIIPVEIMVNYIEFEGKGLNCCFVRDITERKQAEKALRLNNFALERTSDAVYWVSVTEIVDVNESACRMLGYSREEFKGMPLTAIDPLLSKSEILKLWERIKEEGTFIFETQHKAKDGQIIPVEIMVNYIEFEGEGLKCCFVRDITERKQAEEALRLSNFILERTSDAVYWINEATIIDANESACQMLGYSREEFKGMPLTNIDPTATRADLIEVWKTLQKAGAWSIETQNKTKDGRIVPVEISSNYIEFEGKKLSCCFARDITDRKQAEEALRLSTFALESTADAVYWMAPDGCFVDVNEAACSTLGYTREELIGMTPGDIDPGFDMSTWPEIWEKMKGKLPPRETMHRTKDGRLIPVELMPNHIEFEGKEYNCAFARDITERRQAQQALHRSEERLRQAVQVGNIGIFDDNHVTGEIYWSPELRKIFGWGLDEHVTLEDCLGQLHPEERVQVENALRGTHDPAGGDSFDEVMQIIHRSGETRWISIRSLTSSEDVEDERRPVRTVGAVADITERKRAEEEIRQFNEELEQRVIERTKELEEANEEIRHFAYIVSHDLRAPLVNLKGFASELRLNLRDVMDGFEELLPSIEPARQEQMQHALHEDIPEALRFIESSVGNMDTFTKAILKLSRLGRLHLELVEVDVKSIVEKTLDTLAYQIDQQGVKVTIGDLPTITADLMSMEQIFGNILTNAIIYSTPNRPGRIEIGAEVDADDTIFRIKDNGRGIAKQDMDKVFAPFRRAGEQDVSGEGMGLAYVQTLVRRHGGRIWCESVAGKGTTFIFTIPRNLKVDRSDETKNQ
jgi:PAS domain S-box-containing protein